MSFQILQIITPLFLILFAGIGWLYRHEKEKRLAIEKQLSDRKYSVYNNLTTVFFEILKKVKKGQKTNSDKSIDLMIDIKKELLIFGSDRVINKYFTWEKNVDTNKSIISFADLLIEIRKDMGNPLTKIKPADFLKSLIKNEEDFEALKNQGYILD